MVIYIGDYPILLMKWKQHTWGTVNLQTLFLSIVRYPNEIMIHTEAKRVYSYFVCSHGVSPKYKISSSPVQRRTADWVLYV